MKAWLGMINKFLHPHQKKQEKLLARLAEYRDLSSLALESESKLMYSLLQREMNEVFCEYLTLAFLDGIGFLIPHVLVLWLINFRFPYLVLPLQLPWIGNQLPVIIWYPAAAILFYAGRRLLRKYSFGARVNPVTPCNRDKTVGGAVQ
ncbi:hypothetical protein CEB3_c36490 [Peptococcaceae bacterium CEB3]|nr:hypothetical protein CEB3_c36490 [Peptococcaceae bacterium CEB3]